MLFQRLAIVLATITGCCWGQCNGPPLILMPNNSTGNLGFPESNLNSMTGEWMGNNFYPPSVQCTWILKAPPAHVINMRFINFDTEEKFDYVTIYSSEDRSNGTGLFQFSGKLVEDWEAVTPDNLLVLDFVSDQYTTFEGFHLAYRYMPKACVPGGVVLQETQLVALPPWNLQGALPGPPRPGFEPMVHPELLGQYGPTATESMLQWVHVSNYPPGLNCTWQMTVNTRDIIEIKFLRFHTSPSDILQIWKVAGHKVIPFKKFWEGNQPDQSIISSSPLVMNFVSNYGDENLGAGFLLNITYLERACSKDPQEITAPRGFIPYPEVNFAEKTWERENPIHYGPDNCTWILKAPDGYVINITIEELNTRDNDEMEITEGNNQLLQYRGAMLSERLIISETNRVVITFKSETESQNSGFLLYYSWILKDCKYQLPPGGGEIRSPYYPDTYGSKFQCQWTLAPATKSHIVHFVTLRLHMDEGDFLQMSDGKENILLTKDSKPMSKIEFSSAFPIVINFLSDSSANRGYFYFKYTVFESGNCDFAMTTCGWKSLDPLHTWSLDDNNGMVFTQESEKMLLPRGYKSQLYSPILAPDGFNDDVTPEHSDMCLEFEYLIQGPDAYQLNVAVESKESGSNTGRDSHYRIIYEINGPHGDKFLWTAVNFTVAGYYRVIFSYERGYGQHYFAAIDSIRIQNGPCSGSRSGSLYSFTCLFNESFCGWRNTHSDQHNWQLGREGITAMDNLTLASPSSYKFAKSRYVRQFADLISPVVNLAYHFNDYEGHTPSNDSCLHFNYQIFSPLAELKILLIPLTENLALDPEVILWSGGKFASGRVLEAEIPLSKHFASEQFRVIIRTLATNPPKFVLNKGSANINGVLVRNVTLTSGKCATSKECSFSNGFCTWKVLSSGNSAWYIERGNENNSFAAVSSNTGGDLTMLVSSRLKIEEKQSLNFRYKTNSLENQCLQIAIKKGVLSDVDVFNVSSDDVDVLWEQCKDKGNSWLNECVDLPITGDFSQIIITAKFPQNFASFPVVWLDDLRIASNGCYKSEKDLSNWTCLPEDSLCGLTQSSNGFWKWVFIENEETLTKEPNTSGGFSCLNGDIVANNVVCNGYPDCQSAEDEMNCEYVDYHLLESTNFQENSNITSPVTCSDGRELNVSWLCDGILDCEDGSDEVNCGCRGPECAAKANIKLSVPTDTCDDDNFRCFSGTVCSASKCTHDFCIDKNLVCDGVFHCKSREDENNCGEQQSHQDISPGGNDDRMECSGGLYIPKSFKCDGRKDCPLDGKDEVGCHHCRDDEFICHQTGVCLPWKAVCDGELTIETCTDEDFCQTCLPGYFACDVCLDSDQICDGVWDCLDGEDETRCMENPLTSMAMGDSPILGTYGERSQKQCHPEEYRCSSGRCIALNSLCNRIPDCQEGDDEFNCPEDNFEKLKYISAKSETWDHSFDGSASYLTTPVLTLQNQSYGLLSFHYRLDSWSGSANISLSVEIVNVFGNESLLPSCLWRQSGQKGQIWIKEEIVVPQMNTSFQLSFVMIGASMRHHSEKIHLSDLSFKPISSEEVLFIEKIRHDCHFDDSWCGWNQARAQSGYTWIQTMTSPHSRRTGPLAGYSGGKSSGFLLADSLHGKVNNNADLLSPALVLPKDSSHICLRLMAFLHGADIVGISFHTKQRFSGIVFSKELLKISGAQGLNWIPITIDITKGDLSDPNETFFVVIRATRGSGPESDVAVDHVSLTSGTCTNKSNSSAFLSAFPEHPDMYILKAGTPSKPYVSKQNDLDANSTEALEEYCSLFQHCSPCVTSAITKCSWCGEGHFCVWKDSPRAKICSHSWLISHQTVETSVSGSSFCPRIINDKKIPIYFPNNSSPVLQFEVENIQEFHSTDWLCRYSVPNGQTIHTESQEFDDEMVFLNELKSPEVDSEFWNLLKGFAVAEQTSQPGYDVTQVTGSFQVTSASSPNNSHRQGVVTCGNGQTVINLPEGESSALVNISIITPLGNELDNTDSVQVTIYSCEELAADCEVCVSLHSSFECGWCSLEQKCVISTKCHHGRWHSHEDKSVCRIRDDLDILTDLLAAQDNEDDYADQMMNTEDVETFDVSNVKKKVNKSLRKSLQSRKERYSKVEQVETNRNKRKNKDGRGKGEKRRKSEENKKKDKGSRKGRRKSFLKVPFDTNVFIARNMWRLHTGKQYYIPVKKKTLLNLAFVRQVNYGDLTKEKARTVLIDGKWKKAVGFFVDLFENAEDDPVTSIITTKQGIYDQLLGQL